MKKICLVCVMTLAPALTLTAGSASDLLIDSFATPQSSSNLVDSRNYAVGSGILGGERDVISSLNFSANGAVPGQLQVGFPEGLLNGVAGMDITYAGVDHDPSTTRFNGLGSVDLTQGGINSRFRFYFSSTTGVSTTMTIELWNISRASIFSLTLPQNAGVLDVPFSSFQTDLATFPDPVDFHNVGAIGIEFDMASGDSVVLDSIITTVPEPSTLALTSCLSVVAFVARLVVPANWRSRGQRSL